MSHGRCAELQRLAERAASEGQAQRELAEAAQRDFLNRLAAAQAATQTAAGDSAATAAGLREELRAREAELAVLRRREAEAAAQAAATEGAHALRLAALEEAHAARVASLEEAHAARAATLESGRRILLQGGDDRARLKEELLRLHQELYGTQARTASPLARARPVYRGKGLWPDGRPCGSLCPTCRAPRRAAWGCTEPRGPCAAARALPLAGCRLGPTDGRGRGTVAVSRLSPGAPQPGALRLREGAVGPTLATCVRSFGRACVVTPLLAARLPSPLTS